MWIHEHKNWTNFTWDAQRLSAPLSDLRHCQGRLIGRMEGLGFPLQKEAHLHMLTNDIVKSSAIEGEHLNATEVRYSVAQHLGIDIIEPVTASRHVEGIVEMMMDATQKCSKPLTAERLFSWHRLLFPTGQNGLRRISTGQWRQDKTGPMQVVSGPVGHERIHFQAPPAEKVNDEMQCFLQWFDHVSSIDPVLKAGIAHFWFVTIHPFEDGNGRIARAICDMALTRADGIFERFYSMSSQIEAERKDYYRFLEAQQRSTPEITHWLDWFLQCLKRSILNAEDTLNHILFKGHLWSKIHEDLEQKPINERQRMILNCMLCETFEGYMNTRKYAKLAKCSKDTALRDIQDLQGRGILIQNPEKGRSTSYRLPTEEEL